MNVDSAFKLMHKNRNIAKLKGDAGEDILLALCQKFTKNRRGCKIIHSYKHQYYTDSSGFTLWGNIKYKDGEYVTIEKPSYVDEIDVVLITPFRIFVIECKARSGTWNIFDHWVKQGSTMTDKSPICQAEKHARHLYPNIHEYLPDGNPDYIIPLTVFVDKAKIVDKRSKEFKYYIKALTANRFLATLKELNTPLDYLIDIDQLINYMKDIGEGDFYV